MIGMGGSSSDAELSFSESASLSEESVVGFRNAAKSFGRGFVDASGAQTAEDCMGAAAIEGCCVESIAKGSIREAYAGVSNAGRHVVDLVPEGREDSVEARRK